MIAGAKYRGEFEERLKKVMNELKNEDDIIILSNLDKIIENILYKIKESYKTNSRTFCKNKSRT